MPEMNFDRGYVAGVRVEATRHFWGTGVKNMGLQRTRDVRPSVRAQRVAQKFESVATYLRLSSSTSSIAEHYESRIRSGFTNAPWGLAEAMVMADLESNPFRDVVNESPNPLMITFGSGGQRVWWSLDGPIPAVDPVTFGPCRRSSQYQHRRNYGGSYPFGRHRRMVMFESLTELICLMELDHGGEVDDITAQPFGLVFCDRTIHYPDFAARMSDGRTVIIDVKPLKFAEKDAFVHVAVSTEKACATQQWRYQVMHGCRGWQADNLEWMCAFRYEEYVPDLALAMNVVAFLAVPRTMKEVALRLDPRPELGVGYALLSNMMFHRRVIPAEPGPFYPGLMVIAE